MTPINAFFLTRCTKQVVIIYILYIYIILKTNILFYINTYCFVKGNVLFSLNMN